VGSLAASEFPLAANTDLPSGARLHGYVRNNPLKNTDPSGTDCSEGFSSCGNYILGGLKAVANLPGDVINAPNRLANAVIAPFTSFRFPDAVPQAFGPSNADQQQGMEAASAVMLVSPVAELGAASAATTGGAEVREFVLSGSIKKGPVPAGLPFSQDSLLRIIAADSTCSFS